MWMWMSVVHIEMETIPVLEGPWEDGVTLGSPEVQAHHTVYLLSSAHVIPGTDCPHEISWWWLYYWDTDAKILHRKLRDRIFEMMSGRHTEKSGWLLEKGQRKWTMSALTVGQGLGGGGVPWGGDEDGSPLWLCHWSDSWCGVYRVFWWCLSGVATKKRNTTFPENILLKIRIII